MATVKLRYSAPSNITFHGVIDTRIEREDWREMTWREQDDVTAQLLFNLVDIDEVDE